MSEDISKEPVRGRRPEPPEDEPDDRDINFGQEPPFPGTFTAAGALLIVFGSLVLLNLLVSLILVFALAGNAGGQAAGGAMVGGICGSLFVGLIGAVFIQEGVRAVRGTLAGTLGTGIASIAFGGLVLAGAAFEVFTGGVIQGGLAGLVAAMLIVAGVLALVGRSEYSLWRQWRKDQKERAAADRRARRRDVEW
jgi:hypothetical protein